jgi:alkylated DNA repair dioxygenase AlkB
MLKEQFQYQYNELRSQELDLEDADVDYHPDFLKFDEAQNLFDQLLNEIKWRQERITLYGKTHDIPRLSYWMGELGLVYGYSNMTMEIGGWSDTVLKLKKKLESKTQHKFNSVLINYYRNGQDSNGWHSDDEPELGVNPIIASISLGGARDFHLRHKTKKPLRHSISLEHGSFLMIKG